MRKVTIPVTFDVGTIEEVYGKSFTLKVGWFDTEAEDGTELSMAAGAGVGSPYMEGSAHRDKSYVWARADMRPVAEALFNELRADLEAKQ
jgi:hypothetical protein